MQDYFLNEFISQIQQNNSLWKEQYTIYTMNIENSKRSDPKFWFSREMHKALQLGTHFNRTQSNGNATLATKRSRRANTKPLLSKSKATLLARALTSCQEAFIAIFLLWFLINSEIKHLRTEENKQATSYELWQASTLDILNCNSQNTFI